jgi:cell division protein FtsB
VRTVRDELDQYSNLGTYSLLAVNHARGVEHYLACRDIYRYVLCMRSTATLFLLLGALAIAAFSFLSDDGFGKLSILNRTLEQQQRTNAKLSETVQSLKREVNGLHSDARTVEKAARSELGMARPGEMVVIFEKKDSEARDEIAGGSGGKSR